MSEAKYGYSVRTDFGFPILIRYRNHQVETFCKDGTWERTPETDSILYGGGDYVWYDEITEEKARKYMDEIMKP